MDFAITRSIDIIIPDEEESEGSPRFTFDEFEENRQAIAYARLHGLVVPEDFMGTRFTDDDDDCEQDVFEGPIVSQNVQVYDEWAEINELTRLETRCNSMFHLDFDDIGEDLACLEQEFDVYRAGKISDAHQVANSEQIREQLINRVQYDDTFPGMELRNFRLYEFYVMFKAVRDHGGFDNIGVKVWRTLRLALRMRHVGPDNYVKTMVRKAVNYRFEQYINLISLLFGWQLVVYYPYAEHLSLSTANEVNFGLLLKKDFAELPVIVVCGLTFNVDFTYYMMQLSLTELLIIALVSKGFYMMVKEFVKPLLAGRFYNISHELGRGIYFSKSDIRGFENDISELRRRKTYDFGFYPKDRYNIGHDAIVSTMEILELEKYYNISFRITGFTYDVCKRYLLLRDKSFGYLAKYFPVINEGICVLLLGDSVQIDKDDESFWEIYDFYDRDYQFYYLRPFVAQSYAHVYTRYAKWKREEYDE